MALAGACTTAHPPELECGEGGTYHEEEVGRYCAYIVIIGGLSCPPELPHRYEFETGEVVCSDTPIDGESDIPPEVCAAVGRECAQAEDCTWDEVLGGADEDGAAMAVVGDDGTVYTLTAFRGSADFGGGTRSTASSALALIAHDRDGAYLWDRVFDQAWRGAIATRGTGAYVVGSFEGAVDLGGGTRSAAGAGLFIVSIDRDGLHQWDVVFDGAGEPMPPLGVAPGAQRITTVDGGVRVTGTFAEPADFGGGTRTPMGADLFVVALDAMGGYLWDTTFGATGGITSGSIAAGADGQLFVGGGLAGEADFGGGTRTADGLDALVLALDATGGYRWDRVVSGAACAMPMPEMPCPEDYAMSVAVLSDGTVIATGMHADGADFGGGPRTNPSTMEGAMFVAAYDDDGAYVWDHTYAPGSQGFALTPYGANVVVAGWFLMGEDFGGGRVIPVGQRDGLILELTSAGDYVRERVLTGATIGPSVVIPQSITSTPAGHLVVGGAFLGTVSLGHGERTAMGTDGFVTRLCRTR